MACGGSADTHRKGNWRRGIEHGVHAAARFHDPLLLFLFLPPDLHTGKSGLVYRSRCCERRTGTDSAAAVATLVSARAERCSARFHPAVALPTAPFGFPSHSPSGGRRPS